MYCIIDIETTDNRKYGRIHHLYNGILTIGTRWRTDTNCNDNCYNETRIDLDIPSDVTLLVGHNIKYDLLYLWNNEKLQQFFKQEGQIWDTQLVEYIITAQQTKYAALRTLAVEKYKCIPRKKNLDYYWFKKEQTLKDLNIRLNLVQNQKEIESLQEEINLVESINAITDIPKALLEEDVLNDIADTEQVYLQQREVVSSLNMGALIKTQMDGLLATTEMEYNGLQIDMMIFEKNRLQLEQELEKTKQDLYTLIKPYWIPSAE